MRKIVLITVLVLLVYLVLAWFPGTLIGLEGAKLWILRGALWLIGILAAAIVIWFFWSKRKEEEAPTGGEAPPQSAQEIDVLLREAERKLVASRTEKGVRIGTLPVVLVLGEPSSAKTNTVLHSGLELEHLAGQLQANGDVAPTRSANLWFSRRTLFAEAGGRLLEDAPAWNRLIQRLKPRRIGTIFGGGGQAPRAALVCVESERIASGGQAMELAARNLRARLGEIAQAFGIQLPVYAVFTKLDRLPFFADYVRNLSQDEAAQVIGATLPLAPLGASGIYADEQGRRVGAAFDDLFQSLCQARPEFLSRENEATKLPGTYEFPREFRKLRGPLVQLLVDLCRPSQLTVGPYLRGFYFSGVRPVVVQEAVSPAAPLPPVADKNQAAKEATMMFRAGRPSGSPAPAAQPMTVRRKVPQWLFLGRFFNDVLLADRVAMGASGASATTDRWQRALLIAAAAICLILSVGMTVSFFRNRALEGQVLAAVNAVPAELDPASLAPLDSLRQLESLRESLETLFLYRRDGAPWSYRWGLYAGNEWYPDVRRLYFVRFRRLLFGQTQAALLDSLRSLPATPGPAYGPTYDRLKAYLITTSNHDKSTREFLSPVLLAAWSGSRGVDPARLQLAQRQFDFYSEELRTENPFSSQNDATAVDQARRYLSQFAGMERVYQAMLTDAAKTSPSVNFNRKFAGSAAVLIDNRDVAGPFTKTGWDFMRNAIRNPERYFSGEEWVLGSQAAGALDRSALSQQLQKRYQSDFLEQWRAYLTSAALVKYANLKDASQKLSLLSGNQSPLLALFWLASQNTAVDDPQVAAAFQPVQAVVPPSSLDRYIAPPNQNYVNALVTLQASLDGIAAQPQLDDAAAASSLTNATAAHVAARQLAQAFRIDPDGHVETVVQKLLEDPITNAESLLRTLGPAELNSKGKGLCGQLSGVLNKYPFNPNATSEATVAGLNSVFAKPDGALWAFYTANLQKLLPKQGGQYVAATAGGVTLSPAFVNFFNQAAAFSNALYADNPSDPQFTYTLKPAAMEGIQSVGLELDGDSAIFPGKGSNAKQFLWKGSGAHGAKGTVKFGGGPDLGWANTDGLWAVFRLIGRADRREPSKSGEELEWIIRAGRDPITLPGGKPLTVRLELSMGASPPIFQKGFASRMACVADVAKR